jgi:hypothetical protein
MTRLEINNLKRKGIWKEKIKNEVCNFNESNRAVNGKMKLLNQNSINRCSHLLNVSSLINHTVFLLNYAISLLKFTKPKNEINSW